MEFRSYGVCVCDLDGITRYGCFPRKMPVNPPVGDEMSLWEALGVNEEFWEATGKAIRRCGKCQK